MKVKLLIRALLLMYWTTWRDLQSWQFEIVTTANELNFELNVDQFLPTLIGHLAHEHTKIEQKDFLQNTKKL